MARLFTAEELEELRRAYREANREKYNAYMREYMKKRRAARTQKAEELQ